MTHLGHVIGHLLLVYVARHLPPNLGACQSPHLPLFISGLGMRGRSWPPDPGMPITVAGRERGEHVARTLAPSRPGGNSVSILECSIVSIKNQGDDELL
jgi:hypothetical protein